MISCWELRACVQGSVRFEVVWGVSGSNWPLYDLAGTERAIGYVPEQVSHVPEDEWRPKL